MLKFFKSFVFFLSFLALFYLGILVFYFYYPKVFIHQAPDNFSNLNQQEVKVEFFVPTFPGMNWRFRRILVDGVAFPPYFFRGGWKKEAEFLLSEGTHRFHITGLIELFGSYKREVSFNHLYWVDVTPPFLRVANSLRENVYYPTSTWNIEAQTEPLSSVYIFSPTSHSHLFQADKEGKFKGKIFLNSGKNDLVFKVFDLANNASIFRKRVFVDPVGPVIGRVFPSNGELAQTQSLYLKVEASDNLGLRSGGFWVNGKSLKGLLDKDRNLLISDIPLTEDGTYTVKAKIKDLAGNLAVKKWKFNLDTTFILIDLSQRRLYLYREGKVIRTYRVAVGKFGFSTPVGGWKIIGKRKNPVWRNPNKEWSKDMPEFIPPGSGNPLGPRALDLSASLIRIHGTPQIGSIGRAASHGCIRMYPWNVIELFDLVKVGTPVRIQW